jgi:hypothetical protein
MALGSDDTGGIVIIHGYRRARGGREINDVVYFITDDRQVILLVG